jgi:hypothetical protein
VSSPLLLLLHVLKMKWCRRRVGLCRVSAAIEGEDEVLTVLVGQRSRSNETSTPQVRRSVTVHAKMADGREVILSGDGNILSKDQLVKKKEE